MSIVPPQPGEPRRPDGPRDSGDAWVVTDSGARYWGRYGAAGLLAVDRDRGVLLQHRVSWSHFGGTWALPGGALHEGESALDGAVREAQEEAGVPDGAVQVRCATVLDLGVWSYTTVVADVTDPFEPVISDPESLQLAWVPVDEVAEVPLHPAFADAWPMLRGLLDVHPAVVVDAANVVGSRPDGWWKDRAGAAARLREQAEVWAEGGVAGASLGLAGDRWYPPVSFVVEGAARGLDRGAAAPGLAAPGVSAPSVSAPSAAGPSVAASADDLGAGRAGRVATVHAPGHGDDAIVEEVRRLAAGGARVTLVTSDRGLRERAEHLGDSGDGREGGGYTIRVEPVSWLLNQLG